MHMSTWTTAKSNLVLTPLYTSADASMAAAQEKPGAKISATSRFFLYTSLDQITASGRREAHTLFQGQHRTQFA